MDVNITSVISSPINGDVPCSLLVSFSSLATIDSCSVQFPLSLSLSASVGCLSNFELFWSMEDKKQLGPSSAFPSELFGIKEASTSDIFSTIFSLPMKQPSGNQKWSTKQDLSDKNCNPSTANKDKSSNFDKETVEPCYLSSSLYYGGQEMYTQSPTTQTSGSYHTDPYIIRTLLSEGCEYSLLENEVCRATQFTVPASSRAEEQLLCKILFFLQHHFPLPALN
ncbi:hypothetical protein Nepgr_009230 [Nepenthes gracilis]|uniref:Uncharacterized protein n=1 Tax=Nepenthes gracilis TaxID=150966 RepID=A0AAD3SAF8_NEPGR|nr:hypothetical protein Nepgr_009230 [Nepenthes gracilis]